MRKKTDWVRLLQRLLAEFLHALLAGDRLTRALAGAGVGTGALAAGRERTAVAGAPVALDVTQPADVLVDLAAQRALDQVRPVDDADDLRQLLFGQLLRAALAVDRRFLQDGAAVLRADAEEVREADPDGLVVRNVYACDTGHWIGPLSVVSGPLSVAPVVEWLRLTTDN